MNKNLIAKKLKAVVVVAVGTVVLSACGGGGGGSASTPAVDPNLTVPLKSAYANFINNSYSANFSISGWSSDSTGKQIPVSGSGTLSWGAPTASTLNGVTYLTQTQNLVFSLNGGATQTAYTTNVYNSSDYSQYKSTTGGSTSTYTYSSFSIPATVKAGDTGVMGQGVDGSNNHSIAINYSVKSNDATSLLVSVTNSEYAAGMLVYVDTTVYKVKTDGTGGIVSETFQQYSSGSLSSNLVFTVR